jgi:AcrR family transcriptional regulator
MQTKPSTVSTKIPKRLSQRRRPSQKRALRSISALLTSAARLFESEGFDRVTTTSIAEAAGLSVGAVYEYFPNKDAILLALGSAWMMRIREGLDELHPSRSAIPDFATYSRRAMALTEQCYRNQPGLGAVINSLSAIPALRAIEQEHDEHVVESLTTAMAHYYPDADIDDLRAISRTCTVMSHAVFTECLVKGAGDAARMIHKMKIAQYVLVMSLEAAGPGGAAHGAKTHSDTDK